MSDYTNAPATLLLATHCAACSKPLGDAVSVEAGMGPECRKKYLRAETSPENREKANQIVSRIALAISANSAEGSKLAASLIPEIAALGFVKLAEKLTKGNIAIKIERQGEKIVLSAPYLESFVDASRRIPGRFWSKETKTTEFPASQGSALFALLKVYFSGANAIGPKGYFVV